MVQFSDMPGLMPSALHALPFDAWTWEQVVKVLAGSEATSPAAFGAPEDARFRGGAMLHTASGAPVYVVVVERGKPEEEERLPDAGVLRKAYKLSKRQVQVALLLARRLSSQEIADAMGITVHTARRHTEFVLAKMRLETRAEVRPALLELVRRHEELAARHERAEQAAVTFRAARRARAVA